MSGFADRKATCPPWFSAHPSTGEEGLPLFPPLPAARGEERRGDGSGDGGPLGIPAFTTTRTVALRSTFVPAAMS